MASSINASTSGAGGLISTADASGVLDIQTAGTTAISISAAQAVTLTNALPVASGGTGAATLTANNVLLGNGTSAVQAVAPGTSGNVLTSNGTTWTSAALPAGGVTSLNGQTGAITNTDYGAIGSYVAAGSNALGTGVSHVNVTVAGSSLVYSNQAPNAGPLGASDAASIQVLSNANQSASLSGTWRLMTRVYRAGTAFPIGIFVRIS